MHLESSDACSFALPCSSFQVKKAKTRQERPTTPVIKSLKDKIAHISILLGKYKFENAMVVFLCFTVVGS